MSLTFKHLLEETTRAKGAGPSAKFSVFHVLLAIELVAEEPIGRNKLAEILEIGDGAARTLIGRLRDAGLLEVSKAGCHLTKKGLSLWKEYTSTLRRAEVGKNELTTGDYSVAVLARKRGYRLKSGMEQRDAAIVAGAKSATTMSFTGGRLKIPSVSDNVVKDFPRAGNQISKLLKPEEGDAVVAVGADSLERAKHGALAAAWTLL